MDRLAPLLHRITGASYAQLNEAIARLPGDEFARLDALAGEITVDTRAIALVDAGPGPPRPVGPVAFHDVTTDEPGTWQTDAPGPFMTIRAGGPLEGVVTLTAIEGGHGRTLVEATWVQDGHAHRDAVEAETYEHAQIIARETADELASGHAPDLARD